MKYVFRTVMFHFICLFYFGVIYMTCKDEFVSVRKGSAIDSVDCIFLSTAIQSGVGENTIIPLTHYSKFVIMIQEFVMIAANAVLLYFIVKF